MSSNVRHKNLLRGIVFRFRTGPLRRFRAKISANRRLKSTACFIAITGSSGKSTTAGLLSHILSVQGSVRSQILDNTINSVIRTLNRVLPKHQFVVAELGVGSKGEMAPMANMFRPEVAIVTMVGQEHYSAFHGAEAVAVEKGALLEALLPDGLAILNADDPLVMSMAKQTSARVVTFGRAEDADYQVIAVHAAFPEMMSVSIVGKTGQLDLGSCFPGEHFWMPVVAAVATAMELGVPPEIIRDRVADFAPVVNRCHIEGTHNGPTFIVDTVKAPADTLGTAFKMIARANVPFKRIVLGSISDYRGKSSKQYKSAYREARAAADQVIFVGHTSARGKPSEADLASGRYVHCPTPKDAFEHIRRTARNDELILLKGSANLHLERISLAFRHPVNCWEPACGTMVNCVACGAFSQTFDRKALRKKKNAARLKFWRPQQETEIHSVR
ncbi:Mur ligase family protein [Candidatus Halocynthiibacter alkanivorans]|uniref:Mur ligase family protein n=1 Tax=Candidatus Halocynthiibacter alkanivorans TaxID=2267619 RepID=UPI00135A152C|nr:UDP-N-acetylmuramoyl-tripeptide--D-alanyl-D-alanine ligase [Candidatus Halocynthiibacter alkanivorans]